ncbi:MAG: PepSY-associated TM helix domain-containing protein [Gemmataceae bacterium]
MSPFRRGLVKGRGRSTPYVTLPGRWGWLFFAVTGFMLNHEDWFVPGTPHTRTVVGSVPPELLSEPDRLGVAELLRRDFGAVGLVDSFEVDEERLRVVFKRPGTEVEALVDREGGRAEVTVRSQGLAGIALDLHRGKSSGPVWALVIDAVCVVLLVLGTTGLVLYSSLKGRGRYGVAALTVGAMAAAAAVACAL